MIPFLPKISFDKKKLTLLVNSFSAFKIPLLAFCLPKFELLSNSKTIVRINLNYRTKNHMRSMYFGVLAIGAELSIASSALKDILENKYKIDLIFKDFKCQFLKRPDDHVYFICDDVENISQLVNQSSKTKDRVEQTFKGYASLAKDPETPVMTYELTLSLKSR